MTLHRAEAVDSRRNLRAIMNSLRSSPCGILFPVHPRTHKMIERFELRNSIPGSVIMIDPLGYADLLSLIKLSDFVITDSGGVQREAVFMNKPVFIPRPETEWIDFEKAGRIKVVGYEFELPASGLTATDPDDNISHLLRPASAGIAEKLKTVF